MKILDVNNNWIFYDGEVDVKLNGDDFTFKFIIAGNLCTLRTGRLFDKSSILFDSTLDSLGNAVTLRPYMFV